MKLRQSRCLNNWCEKLALAHTSACASHAGVEVADIPNATSLRTTLAPNTCDHDGIGRLWLTAAKRYGNVLKVGPRARARSGLS
jgi:hypothetical protein